MFENFPIEKSRRECGKDTINQYEDGIASSSIFMNGENIIDVQRREASEQASNKMIMVMRESVSYVSVSYIMKLRPFLIWQPISFT